MNLSFSINEFFKEFADMHVISLINMFFEYDQISFIKKNYNMMMIMILIDLF